MKTESVINPWRLDQAEFRFRGFRFMPDGTLLRGDRRIHVPPKEAAALRLLVARAGKIVSAAQLKKAVWGEVHVSADSIPRCVSSLRAALEPEECIETLYKRGYRFVGKVTRLEVAIADAPLRLAIMPFVPGPDVPEYLGTAVAEEVMSRLGDSQATKGAAFSLVARDSVFALAERGLPAEELGKLLRTDLVLKGSLRALPSHYRLRAEMIRVEDAAEIWIEELLVPRDSFGGLEAALAGRLVFRLGGAGVGFSAGEEEQDDIARDPMRCDARELHRLGRHEMRAFRRQRVQEGFQHLSRATELAPTLVPAQVDLVNICVTQALYGFMSPALCAEQVRRTAKLIPERFDGAASILPSLGWIRFHVDRDLPGALAAFEASAHLPADPWTTRARAMFALSRWRFDEAIEVLREALEADPYSPWLNARLAWAFHLSGEASRSLAQIERTLEFFPENDVANLYATMILAHNGDTARAVGLSAALSHDSPYCDLATAIHGYALARAGKTDEARALVEQLEWLSRERYVMSTFTAAIYLSFGDLDRALAELSAANEARCPWFFQMLADPRLEPLHNRPEFAKMRQILASMEAGAAQH